MAGGKWRHWAKWAVGGAQRASHNEQRRAGAWQITNSVGGKRVCMTTWGTCAHVDVLQCDGWLFAAASKYNFAIQRTSVTSFKNHLGIEAARLMPRLHEYGDNNICHNSKRAPSGHSPSPAPPATIHTGSTTPSSPSGAKQGHRCRRIFRLRRGLLGRMRDICRRARLCTGTRLSPLPIVSDHVCEQILVAIPVDIPHHALPIQTRGTLNSMKFRPSAVNWPIVQYEVGRRRSIESIGGRRPAFH